MQNQQSGERIKVLLDGYALANWLASVSLVTPDFLNVPLWTAQLAAGKPQSIAASRAGLVTPPGFVGYGLTYGVICSEWYPFATEENVLTNTQLVLPTYPPSVLAQAPQFTFIFDDCRVWDVPEAPLSALEPPRSGIPTLILSGSFDAITSLAWAEVAAETLPNSTIVQIPGVGHFVAAASECARSVIASFLERPDMPDTSCTEALEAPPFATP